VAYPPQNGGRQNRRKHDGVVDDVPSGDSGEAVIDNTSSADRDRIIINLTRGWSIQYEEASKE
jgi:hypothetical protein